MKINKITGNAYLPTKKQKISNRKNTAQPENTVAYYQAVNFRGNLGKILTRNQISFKGKAEEAKIPEDAFFIRMNWYKRSKIWAKEMIELTQSISDMIKQGEDFDTILYQITEKIKKINKNEHFGKKRIIPSQYKLTAKYRGNEYFEIYKSRLKGKEPYVSQNVQGNQEYYNANTCNFYLNKEGDILINYGFRVADKFLNLRLAKKEFEKLRSIENPTDEEINRSAATIHWLIAQESPYERGNDSIANVLTKAIYLAYGMKISPIKEGKSFDFEAFYSDLDDYIKKYPNLFEIPPHRE